jgi:endogenous inhibitor of DNA gyrase (YacG/DUF329 family)
MSSQPKLVACPTCGRNVPWMQANAWRPFCSERCKLIDLGAWADESYRIPVTESKNAPEEDDPSDKS